MLSVCGSAGARTSDPWLCSQTHCQLRQRVFKMWFISEATSEYMDVLSECEPPHDKTNKMAFAPSENSDQPKHSPSLIRVFAVHSMGSWGPNASSYEQPRLCSDWADAQAYLSLRWTQRPFYWFCNESAHVYIAAESPSVESESDCKSRGHWFDSGPATYLSLRLIRRKKKQNVFPLTRPTLCQPPPSPRPWSFYQ